MKTLEELQKEILANEELKAELSRVKSKEELDAFFAAHDCSMNTSELKGVLADAEKKSGSLSMGELNNVSGGTLIIVLFSCFLDLFSVNCTTE